MSRFVIHSQHHHVHHVDGVLLAQDVTVGELLHVAIQMLRAELLERPVVPAFEQGLERLGFNRVRLSAHVVADRVLHGLMLGRQRFVRTRLVRIDSRLWACVIRHESLDGFHVRR